MKVLGGSLRCQKWKAGQRGRSAQAASFWQHAAMLRCPGIRQDYNLAIMACEESTIWEAATGLFRALRVGLVPDLISRWNEVSWERSLHMFDCTCLSFARLQRASGNHTLAAVCGKSQPSSRHATRSGELLESNGTLAFGRNIHKQLHEGFTTVINSCAGRAWHHSVSLLRRQGVVLAHFKPLYLK